MSATDATPSCASEGNGRPAEQAQAGKGQESVPKRISKVLEAGAGVPPRSLARDLDRTIVRAAGVPACGRDRQSVLRSIGFVSCGVEEAVAFLFGAEVAEIASSPPELVICACGGAPGHGLELGEGHLDRGCRLAGTGTRRRPPSWLPRRSGCRGRRDCREVKPRTPLVRAPNTSPGCRAGARWVSTWGSNSAVHGVAGHPGCVHAVVVQGGDACSGRTAHGRSAVRLGTTSRWFWSCLP